MMDDSKTARIAAYIAAQYQWQNRADSVCMSSGAKEAIKAACKTEIKQGSLPAPKEPVNTERLYWALCRMNAESLRQRYNDKIEENMPKTMPQIPYHAVTDCVTMYKLIQCYLYQCAEGDVEESPLYKAVDTFCNNLCAKIVESLPQYNAVAWG
jgi:hypothetical protein